MSRTRGPLRGGGVLLAVELTVVLVAVAVEAVVLELVEPEVPIVGLRSARMVQ